MKRRILCLFLTICMLFGTLSILTACGGDGDPCIQCIDLDNNGKCDVCKNVIEKEDDGNGDKPATANFVIKADKTEAARSETVTLSAFLKSGETEEDITSDVEFSIVSGTESATILGNVLTIKSTASHGDVIKVKAREGATDSNEITITVKVPATAITISQNGSANILAGQSVAINSAVTPTGANNSVSYVITEGKDYASFQSNVLMINTNAPTGATVKVKAVLGEVESNELTFTIGYPLTGIAISSTATNIVSGQSTPIGVIINPENSTNANYVWTFVEGGDYASFVGNSLVVNANAPTGAIIKVKAVAGSIESNVLSFTVGYPLESLTIASGATNIVSGQSALINVLVNPTNSTNANYAWNFVEGGDYASFVGNSLVVNANAPTGAIIKVKAVAGSIESNVISFTVGYPLQSLTASLIGSANIKNGNSAQLVVSLNPTNATNGDYTWQFVEGADYATIIGGIITISDDAPIGSMIKIKAVAGSVESNVLSIIVGTPIETIAITSTAPQVLDRGANYPLSSTVTPAGASTNAIRWVVSEGAPYVTVEAGRIFVANNTPAGTKVTIYAESGSIKSNELSFTVGIVLEKLDITLSGSQNVDPNTSRPISHTVSPSNASDKDIEKWVFDEGAEYAFFNGNTLFVNSDAPIGAKVTFHAEIGSVKSNSITITVGTPAESIDITLNGSQNVDPEGTRVIDVVLSPAGASNAAISWVVDSGEDYATIKNGVITVNDDAPIGAKVTFHAEIAYATGVIKSESITITVGTPIESIEISALGSTNIMKGNSVGLDATLTPSKASESLITWIISEGGEYASIKGTTLIVNADATTGATIKVKAVFDTVESNEIEFTVMATQEEINASKYLLDLNTNSIRIDKKGTDAPILVAEILNGNYDYVTDMNVSFSVIEGAEYLELIENGYSCSFQAIGHGKATVKVEIAGTNVSELVTVDVIVPPDAVILPEVFVERPLFDYTFSKIDRLNGNKEASLPFVPSVKGADLACTDLVYNFVGENGKTGSDVAVYENGAITFKTTGKVIVTVSSASGSKVEATTSYTFSINEGYNVHTFEELNYLIRRDDYIKDSTILYDDSLPINVVVLEKPVGEYEYKYGYDLVPLYALKPQSEHTIPQILRSYTSYNGVPLNSRIQAVNKGVWINGNNHTIDVSQVKVFTVAEYDAYVEQYNVTEYISNWSSLLSIEPWHKDGPGADPSLENRVYNAKFYNISVKGNTPVDYDPKAYGGTDQVSVGSFSVGISIGTRKYDVQYLTDAENLTASGFDTGIKVTYAIDGSLRNLHVDNCYSTGIRVHASIVEFENIKIGKCGATGIEIAPENSNMAGIDQNEPCKITFSGTIDAYSNLNNGNTSYFSNYKIMGATIPQIITGNTAMYNANQVNHIRNAKGEFIFVSLLFNDLTTLSPNHSIVNYPAYQAGGIIDISALPTSGVDTEHQFVKMTVYVDIPGLGQQVAGTAYFYNHNYIAK